MADLHHIEVHTFASITAAESRASKQGGLASLIVPLNQSQLLMEIYSGGMPSPKAPVKPVEAPKPVVVVQKAPPTITYVPAPQAPKVSASPVVVKAPLPVAPTQDQAPVIEPSSAKVSPVVASTDGEQPLEDGPPATQQKPILITADDSSHFSESDDKDDKAGEAANKKEELKRKLELLKEKLKKAKSVQEKTKLLEKERDKDLLKQRKKTEAKQEIKLKVVEKRQDRNQHASVSVEKDTQPRQPREVREVVKKPATPQAKKVVVRRERESLTPVKKQDKPKNPATKPSQQTIDANAPEEAIDYGNKLQLVDELAKRWWYAMPQWPPIDFDYETELQRRSFELVESNRLREESKLRRVCQVEAYPGVYKDSEGKLHDLRPTESMPSLQNFQKKTVQELQTLLLKAYTQQQTQIVDMLEGRLPNYDREIEHDINVSLGKKLKRIARYM